MKKLFALLLALTMVFSLATTAFAVDITIKGEASEYKAWKLFDATISSDGENFSYTVNSTYRAALQAVVAAATSTTETTVAPSTVTDTQILTYVSGIVDKSDAARTFADAVYAQIKAMDADATTTTKVFEKLAQGYYLIAETTLATTGNDEADDTYSLVMLDTAGLEDIEIESKEDKPSLSKEIKHNELGTWGVVGDNQIGDTVEFRTITTVPTNISKYPEGYDYEIVDTMSAGLTSNVMTVTDVTIKINDTDVLGPKYYTIVLPGESETFTFKIDVDIAAAVKDSVLSGGEMLYSYYTGTLNERALVYDEGKQDNKAKLVYDNNPYDTEDEGETPEDIVYDWTFKMGVNKVDEDGNALEGAKFALSKVGTLTPELYTEGENKGKLKSTTDLIPLVLESNGVYHVATSEEIEDEEVSKTYIIEGGSAIIQGLDDTTKYYLYEVEAPAGYNKLTAPVDFTITANDYSTDGATYNSVSVKVGETTEEGMATDVVNKSGTELPSTGGMGTTLFYIVGGIMVAAAVVLLVTKKRMGAEA